MNSNYTLKDFAILVVLFVLALCLTSCATSTQLTGNGYVKSHCKMKR